MKKIIGILVFTITFFNLYAAPEDLSKDDYKLIMSSQDMRKDKEEHLDINKATKQEMLSRGVASSYVNKILEYREITGGFEKIENLKDIKGIGQATYEKLKKFFKVVSETKRKDLSINTADDLTLKYFGFSKKEIKELRKYLDKYDRISNNIELKKVIDKKKYEKLKDNISYGG